MKNRAIYPSLELIGSDTVNDMSKWKSGIFYFVNNSSIKGRLDLSAAFTSWSCHSFKLERLTSLDNASAERLRSSKVET